MNKYPKKSAAAVILDIRNFTPTFNLFQQVDSPNFLGFIERINEIGIELGLLVNDQDFYSASTGDGFLVLLFGERPHFTGYVFGILLSKIIDQLCLAFNKHNSTSIGFGIGTDYGYVQEISISKRGRCITTYLGDVINKASRLEAETKSHSRAPVIFGENLVMSLTEDFLLTDYREKVSATYAASSYDKARTLISEMNTLNEKLMLSYLFEHRLKGVLAPQKIYRLSPTLSSLTGDAFWQIIGSMFPDRIGKFQDYFRSLGRVILD